MLPAFLLAILTAPAWPAALEEIRNDPKLTPARLVRYFSTFKYQFHAEVQPPEVFLATRQGDCDDFATLADQLLRERGYTTRLVAVRMPAGIHVVCYVEETEGYLDFNNRGYLFGKVSVGPELSKIAERVANSFRSEWISVSEFTFSEGVKRLVATQLREGGRDGPARGWFASAR